MGDVDSMIRVTSTFEDQNVLWETEWSMERVKSCMKHDLSQYV